MRASATKAGKVVAITSDAPSTPASDETPTSGWVKAKIVRWLVDHGHNENDLEGLKKDDLLALV